MKTLLHIDQSALVHALGLTLIHSLWQGALLMAALLLVSPKLRTSRIRYLLFYSTLCCLTILSAGTFVWAYELANTTKIPTPEPVFSEVFLPIMKFAPGEPIAHFSPETWYPLLVGLWEVGLVFFLLKLGGGMLLLRRLRRTAAVLEDHAWQHRVDELARRLALSRPVLLLESVLVHTPLTLGFLKPLILMPVGLINQLSTSEVEAILAHELAHIARRDWLFNLLQAFMETLFYYHPAVWWLSHRIRAERENCCDDVAVALSGNPLMYAKTLVRLQEMARPTPLLAPALHGSAFALRRNHRPMLMRIKRILNPSQATHYTMEKIVATAILIVLIVLWTIRSGTDNFTSALKAMNPVEWVAAQTPGFGDFAQTPLADTLPPTTKNTRKIVREDDNSRVEMELQYGEIKRLNIDGKEISSSNFNKYEALIAEMMEESTPPPPPPAPPSMGFPSDAPRAPFVMTPQVRVTTETDGDNTVIKLNNGGKPLEIVVKDGKVWIDGKAMENGESLNMPYENFDFSWGEDGGPALVFPPDGAVFFNDHQNMIWAPNPPDFPSAPGNFYPLSPEDKLVLEKEIINAEKEMAAFQKQWSKESAQMQKDLQVELRNMQREQELHQRQMQRMQLDMARDGLIDKEKYSFQLSSKKLFINGEKQSDALHQKYLKLYEDLSGKKMEKGDNVQMNN